MRVIPTKLRPPPLPPSYVDRARLRDELAGHAGITTVFAPAGSGKTVLLADLATHCDDPLIWLSVDDRDRDPVRLWTHLSAAVHAALPPVGGDALELLEEETPAATEAAVDTLLAELVADGRPATLVLDDIHLAASEAVSETLGYFLEHRPHHLRAVLAGRRRPELPLARLRVAGELAELGPDDLRFRDAEATDLVRRCAGADIADTDVAVLVRRIEGWAAGLQLAGLSLRDRPVSEASGVIATFGGNHRAVAAYLVSEVLETQPPDVQQFLLDTSVLDRFDAALCAAVTGSDDATRLLRHVEAANLLLVPLDDGARWYRYHHLFGELLRDQLAVREPTRAAELHRRAATWWEQRDEVPEAIEHWLASGEFDRAAELIAQRFLDDIRQGRIATVSRWFDALPDTVVASRPETLVLILWHLLALCRADEAEPWLERAEKAAFRSRNWDAILLETSLARAAWRRIRGEPRATLEAVEATFELLDRTPTRILNPDDGMRRSVAYAQAGRALGWLGDRAGAESALRDGIAAVPGNAVGPMTAGPHLAWLLADEGRLCDADVVLTQVREAIAQLDFADHPTAAEAYVVGGRLLRERGYGDEAMEEIDAGLDLSQQGQAFMVIAAAMVEQAQLLFDRRQHDEAFERLGTARQLDPWGPAPPHLLELVAGPEVRLRLAVGDVDGARARLTDISAGALGQVLAASVDLAAGDADAALDRVVGVGAAGATPASLRCTAEARLIEARARIASGDRRRATTAAEAAIAIAAPQGLVRVVLDAGGDIEALLDLVRRQHAASNFLRRVEAVATGVDRTTGAAAAPASRASLLEPLSDREAAVLALLPTQLTNHEISRRLYVSRNTVKTHLRNLYRKLGVATRAEAVVTGRSLGLL